VNGTPSQDHVRGIFLGAAIGDAMGMPFQFLHPQVVRELFPKRPEAYLTAPEGHVNAALGRGHYTDETQLLILTAESLLQCGDVDVDSVAAGMLQLYETDGWITPGRSVLAACRQLQRGRPWFEAGGYRDGSKPLAFVPPLVIRHFTDNDAIVHHGTALARGILVEPKVLAGCACFGLLLKNICLCRDSGELADAVRATADCMAGHHPAFRDMLLWVLSLLDTGIEEGLEELGTGYSVLETLFAALFAFLKYPDDFLMTVSSVIYAGDNADTTGFLAGALSGAFNTFERIPENLVAGLRDHEFLIDLADRFYSFSSSLPS